MTRSTRPPSPGVPDDAFPLPGHGPVPGSPAHLARLHHALAAEIRGELNRTLPSPYYARLEMRPELGIAEEGNSRQRIIPDITVVRYPHPTSPGGRPWSIGLAGTSRPRSNWSSPAMQSGITSSKSATLRGPQTHHPDRDTQPVEQAARPRSRGLLGEATGSARERRPPDRDRPATLGRPGLARPQPDRPDRPDRPPARLPGPGQPGLATGRRARVPGLPVLNTRVAPLHPGPPEAGRARGAARPPVRLQPRLRRRPLPRGAVDYAKPPEPPSRATTPAGPRP